MKARVCELCNGEVFLYCTSDSAFLCWKCDARVHEANFLVARHVRRTVCSRCKGFDGNTVSGVGIHYLQSICRSCLPDPNNDDLDSSSSTCAESFTTAPEKKIKSDHRKTRKIACSSSVTEVSGDDDANFPAKFSGEDPSKKKKRGKNLKAEMVFSKWCRKLGVKKSCGVAVAALRVCRRELTDLPFQVSQASAFWFTLKVCEGRSMSTCQNLKRLEEISGVPAKQILSGEAMLSRFLKIRKPKPQRDLEEGWAESPVLPNLPANPPASIDDDVVIRSGPALEADAELAV
ncbi:hypothetical protein HHK36_026116 [Tetracentron sinense]|uniref:B box-type domain-containing protein n=1 Tax=Tetracentron sinense TaxID=13715 RepID=A0A834YPJ3_TETSI|nr:hypothetical protein HHK36_026116 [Tetracentron sinense]